MCLDLGTTDSVQRFVEAVQGLWLSSRIAILEPIVYKRSSIAF